MFDKLFTISLKKKSVFLRSSELLELKSKLAGVVVSTYSS